MTRCQQITGIHISNPHSLKKMDIVVVATVTGAD